MKAWIEVEKNHVHDYLLPHIPEVFANDSIIQMSGLLI